MFYRDLVFTSMLSPHKNILEVKECFKGELVNIFERRCDINLLTEMIIAQTKTINPISYIKALVVMRQVVKALKTLHKQRIFNGNLKPSCIIFQNPQDWHSLKLTGFEYGSLFTESKYFNEKFDEVFREEDIYLKMKIHQEII